MKEIVVSTPNNVGTLANLAETLGSSGVNIESITAYGVENKAIFRIITTDSQTALKVLGKIPNAQLSVSDILIYKMVNRPGELGKLTKKLANRGIDLESIYIVGKKDDYTEVALRPTEKDFEKALELIKK